MTVQKREENIWQEKLTKKKYQKPISRQQKKGVLTEGQLFAFSQFVSQFTDEFGYMIKKIIREFCPDIANDIYKLHHFKIMDDMIYLNYDAGELGEREATFYMPLNWIGSNLTKKEKKIEGKIAELENRKKRLQKMIERKSETLKYQEEEYERFGTEEREAKQ